ncbi:MAG: phosphodiester glycosidase family protein [Verrucomicrobia bacterium]|nr:phosphodiester glycosidase family protein [Verrucomicrobiota bacterium]
MGLSFWLAAWAGQAATNATLWHEPGVDYYCDANPRIPLAVHVVKIDRAQKDLEFHTTLGGKDQIGMAVLSEQVKFIKPELGQPVAAINGDYFYVDAPFAGDPMNLQILRGGELVSAPGVDRVFFYLDAKGEPHITNAVSGFSVTWPDGKSTPVALNETPATTEQAVLYTTAAGATTRIEGIELTLVSSGQGPWLPLRIGQTLAAKVRQVNKRGYSRLTPESMVLSLSPKTVNQFPPLVPGMELKISTKTTPDLTGAIMAVGGGPGLVRGGKARDARDFHGFQVRNPRSALGWNDKYYYFVQVDGRQPRYSMGMTLEELAEYFVKLKCDYAINLDGGGSCTTWVGGKIVNSPSQRGRERPSANALVLVRKNKASR